MKPIEKRSDCPISYCLDFLGDKWTLLIVRDMILDEKTSFGDFLASDEHIATNILTTRLKTLEAEGLVIKYPLEGKVRSGYCLTKKGISLIPIIIEMSLWGAYYGKTNPKKEFGAAIKKDKGEVIKNLTDNLTQKYKKIRKAIAA